MAKTNEIDIWKTFRSFINIRRTLKICIDQVVNKFQIYIALEPKKMLIAKVCYDEIFVL